MKTNSKSNSLIAFIAIILGFFMALLDTTIVNITLPKMTEHFNTSMQHISWITNGYNLAFAVLIITASRLADQFGRKKLFMCGVFFFTLSSVLSGMSTSVNMLIFFRILQGLSAAFVVPTTVPLSVGIFPPEKRGMVIGLWGAFAGLAAASGPALGGILTQYFSWRSVFFINLPVGVASLILTAKYIKESYDTTSDRKIDWGGMITLSSMMFSLTLALIKANEWGWTSTSIISLFATAIVSLILFLIIEVKTKSPMLPMSLFKIVPFSAGAAALFILGIGMMAGAFFLSFFLTQVKGLSQLSAGLTISSMALASMFFSGIIGPFTEKLGGRWFSGAGLALMALACFLYSSLNKDSSIMDIVLRLIVGGAGMGLSMSSIMGSMIRNIPEDKVGMASGVNNMTRTLGTVLGVAVLLTIFNTNVTTQMTNAKAEAVSEVKMDTVFTAEAKQKMINNLKSSSSKKVDMDKVMAQIDVAESVALKNAPRPAYKKIKNAFKVQKRETVKIYKSIETTFSNHMVNAFSITFKAGSLILLPGIFFALFSDKKRKREEAVLEFNN